MAERPISPYREPAREVEGQPRRGAMGCVTWIGALGIAGVLAFVVAGAARELGRQRELETARETFASLSSDPRIILIAHRFDPDEQPMPVPPELDAGEQTDVPYVANIESEGDHPAIAPGARGLLIASDASVDAAQLGRSRRAAEAPDEVRWIGVVERRLVEDAYRYASVGVDVERAFVVLVDLDTQRPIARITMEAAPPSHTQTPRETYTLEDRRIWQAIERALR